MMPLFIIGLLLMIIAIVGGKTNESIYRVRGLMILGGIVLMTITIAYASVVQINPGEVGVKVWFGEVQNDVLPPGLNVIVPFMEVEPISTKTRNYTMSGMEDNQQGRVITGDPVKVLSKDGLEVTIDVTVLYRVLSSEAPVILQEIGFDFEDKIVRAEARTRIREFAVQYDAVELYSGKRDEFQQRVDESIRSVFNARGLLLESLLIRNISLPESVRKSIERKINAIQEAERMEFVLDKGRQEAELKRVEARGIADAQSILNEGLTPKVLQYEMIKMQKDLAESQNTKIIMLGGDGKSVPFILGNQ